MTFQVFLGPAQKRRQLGRRLFFLRKGKQQKRQQADIRRLGKFDAEDGSHLSRRRFLARMVRIALPPGFDPGRRRRVPLPQSVAPANSGVIAMTQVLAAEWARFNIRVNCIAPGVMATEATQQMTSELDDSGLLVRALEARTPVGRLGDPEEIAATIAFLASGETDFLTCSTLYVDGGWTSYGDYSGWGFARSLVKQQA